MDIFASMQQQTARKSKEGFAWLETGEESTLDVLENKEVVHQKASSATSDMGVVSQKAVADAIISRNRDNRYANIGQALWNALRREQRSAVVQLKMKALVTNAFNS
jgi:hypothetical protein